MENQNQQFSLDYWDKVLDQEEMSIGLPKYNPVFQHENEIHKYLALSREQLGKLIPSDCSEISYLLSEYAFHLQRSYNRELTRINWATSNIKQIIIKDMQQLNKYNPYIERFEEAIKNNEIATRLNKIKIYAQQRADRINFLASQINTRISILLSLQNNKKRSGYG